MVLLRMGVIVCEPGEKWRDLGDLWKEKIAGNDSQVVECLVFNAFRKELPRRDLLMRSGDKGGIDLIVFTGSFHSVRDPQISDWLGPVEDLIRYALCKRFENEAKVHRCRILAGCFGAQLVAQAMGGKVKDNSTGKFVFQAEEVRLHPAFRMFPWAPPSPKESFRLLESHGECVAELPRSAIRLGTSSSCVNEIFYVPPEVENAIGGGALCFQSHPEFEVEKHMVGRVLPSILSKKIISKQEGEYSLKSFEERSLDSDAFLIVMNFFASGELYRQDLDSSEFQESLQEMRGAVQASISALVSNYETEIRRIRGGSENASQHDGMFNTSSQNKDEHPYFVKSDLVWKARAEALLRGVASLPEVAKGEFTLTEGWIPSMIQTSKDGDIIVDGSICSETISKVHDLNILTSQFLNLGKDVYIASGGADKKIVITKIEGDSAQVLGQQVLKAPVIAVRPRPSRTDGSFVAASMGGDVELWRFDPSSSPSTLSLDERSKSIHSHLKMITAASWSQSGEWFATACRDRVVNYYHVTESKIEHRNSFTCSGSPDAIEFIQCLGCMCLVVAVRGEHRLLYVCVDWIEEQEAVLPKESILKVNMNSKQDDFVSFAVLDCAAAPSNLPLLATATDRSRIIIFRAASSQQYRNLYGHMCTEFSRSRLAWDPTARFLMANSEENMSVMIWSVVTGELVKDLRSHKLSIRDVGICDNSESSFYRSIVTASFDRTIKIWQVQSGDSTATF